MLAGMPANSAMGTTSSFKMRSKHCAKSVEPPAKFHALVIASSTRSAISYCPSAAPSPGPAESIPSTAHNLAQGSRCRILVFAQMRYRVLVSSRMMKSVNRALSPSGLRMKVARATNAARGHGRPSSMSVNISAARCHASLGRSLSSRGCRLSRPPATAVELRAWCMSVPPVSGGTWNGVPRKTCRSYVSKNASTRATR